MKLIVCLFLLLINFVHWVRWLSNRELELHSTTFEEIGNFFLINSMLLLSVVVLVGFYELKNLPNIKNPKNLRVYEKQFKLRMLFIAIGIFYIILGLILPLFFERSVFFIPYNSEYSLLLFGNAYYILPERERINN